MRMPKEYTLTASITPSMCDVPRMFSAALLLGYYTVPNTVLNTVQLPDNWPVLQQGPFTLDARLFFCAVAVVTVLAYTEKLQSKLPFSLLFIAVWIYILLLCAGMLVNPSISEINCGLILIPLTFGLLSARLCGSSEKTVVLLCVLGMLEATFAIKGYCDHDRLMLSGTVMRAGGTFYNPTSMSELMLVNIPLSATLMIYQNKVALRVLFGLLTVTMFVAIMLTFSRDAIFGLGCSLTYLTLKFSRSRTVTVIAIAALITCVLVIGIIRSSGQVNSASAHRSSMSRVIVWKEAFQVFRHHPTGVGIGSLKLPVSTHYEGHQINDLIGEPKNLLLDWLDEMGVGGAILLALFVVGGAQSINSERGRIGVGLAACWIALLVAGIFDTPFGVASRAPLNAVVGALLGIMLLTPKSTLA